MIDSLRNLTRVGIPEDLAVSIVQYLRAWNNQLDLRVNPDDDIYRRFGIVDEDLDDFVLTVADEIGRRPPDSTSYWPTPVTTVEDLAKFVLSFPAKEDARSDA